jgi:ADP-heptose:LPS heptosyltransferase
MTNFGNGLGLLKRATQKIMRSPAWLIQLVKTQYRRAVREIVMLLTDRYWIIDYLPKKSTDNYPVLLVRLDLIGDFVIWLDAAKEFKNLYPNQHIVLYANATWAALAETLPYWDEVVWVDVHRLRGNDLYRLSVQLKIQQSNFFIAIQPTYSREYVGDSLIRASNAASRIGHCGDLNNIRADLKLVTDSWYTSLVPDNMHSVVELSKNADLIRALGLTVFKSDLPQLLTFDLLTQSLKIDEPYCVIVPGASWAPKTWPAAHFAQLAGQLSSELGLKIVLCGSSAEKSICDDLEAFSGIEVLNLAGLTSLAQLVEVIRSAKLLVANDSAAVHIAVATTTPAVCILGGGHFGRFLPYKTEVVKPKPAPIKAVFAKMDCYGCSWHCHLTSSDSQVVPCVENVAIKSVLDACLSLARRKYRHD